MLLVSAALAAPALPEAADLAALAIAGISAAPGCATFTGDVHQLNTFNVFRSPSAFTWSGTLRDGAWSGWDHTRLEGGNHDVVVSFDVGDRTYPFLPPFFGTLEGAATDEPDDGLLQESRQLLAELLDVAGTPVELETVEREGDVILYRRELSSRWSFFGRRENVVEVRFDPTSLRPVRWDVRLEHPVRADRGASIVRLTLSLAADAEGWPLRDTIDVTGAYGLLWMRVRREITFTRSSCP